MALAILGMFVFSTRTVPFSGLGRSQSWNHPSQQVVGDMPPSQYTGKSPEEISISAELRPEVTGGIGSIGELRKMADSGKPYQLILGNGQLMGSYDITELREERSELMYDSTPRAIAFSMSLKKISDHAFGLEGQALAQAAGMIRALTGF